MGLKDLFKNILGYPLLGKVQKNIVDDLIDVPKWKTNVDYAQQDVHWWSALDQNSDDPETRRLAISVDTVFAKIIDNISIRSVDYPSVVLSGRLDCLYFLAAYPDVFDYFYPSADCHRESITSLGQITSQEQANKDFDVVYRRFMGQNNISEDDMDDTNFVDLLLYLKNYYRDEMKKSFRLARFNEKNESGVDK